MALRVWLPLLGNLDNQGASTVTVTNNGAVVDNAGKIGKCYKFNGSNSYLTFSSPINLSNNFSICCWLDLTDISAVQYFVQFGSGGIRYSGSDNSFLYFSNSQSLTWTFTRVNRFVHVTFVCKSNSVSLYVDGVKVGNSIALTGGANTCVGIGRRSDGYYYNGKINDFRIYDHCLSAREVQEVAKGLVAHYTLDDSYGESTTNLITTQDCLSNSCYNGAIGAYGYGVSTGIYKTTGSFNDKFGTKVYTNTTASMSYPYPYVSNLFVASASAEYPEYKTLSFDFYGTIVPGNVIVPYKLGNGTATCTWKNTTTGKSGSATNSANISVVPGSWNHIEMTLHAFTTASAQWGYIRLGSTSHSASNNNYWLFANMQLEEKDHATAYAGVGGVRVGNKLYDCSGNGYHGTCTDAGNPTVISGSPRRRRNVKFDTTAKYYQITNLPALNVYSLSWWMYQPSPGGASKMPWGYANGNRLNFYGYYCNTGDGSNNPYYVPGTTTTIALPPANMWHHMVQVGDGTNVLLYMDGELYGQAKTYKAITGTTLILNGWTTTADYRLAGAQLSDFRLYATALTAAQVKELYNNPISICKGGTLMCMEVVE